MRDISSLKEKKIVSIAVECEARLSWRSFYTQMANKHSFGMLTLGLAGSLMFVAAGIWLLATGEQTVLAIFVLVFFGFSAVGWGYALSLKRVRAGAS